MNDLAEDGIITTSIHHDGTVTIDDADPRLWICADRLDEARSDMTFMGAPATLDGDVLRIDGANRTVIYRIGPKVEGVNAYLAEWPD